MGYRAPSYKFSKNTLDLLLQEGFKYDSSLMGDDIPYRLTNGKSALLELPSHYALDDWGHYMFSREFDYKMPIKAPSHAMDVFRAEFAFDGDDPERCGTVVGKILGTLGSGYGLGHVHVFPKGIPVIDRFHINVEIGRF